MRQMKLKLRSAIYFVRYAMLRAKGYTVVNPACRNWESYSPRKMRRSLDHIFGEARITTPVRSLVDHGCWDGHYADALRPYTQRLIGLDILDVDSVPGYDQYIKASPEPDRDYLSAVPDDSVDLVLIIASVGMHVDGGHDADPHCGDWRDYIGKTEERQGRYFTPNNYPRVVKPGGHIVIQEWEAYPELRLGRGMSDHAIRARMREFYPHSDIPGFTVVTKGISPDRIGPYIVYRKN